MNNLDELAPKLTELELAIALNACREAGAVNAANALSKHITRLQIELLRRELELLRLGVSDRPQSAPEEPIKVRLHGTSESLRRDPDHIPAVLDVLRRCWEANPQLRLGQLLCNAISDGELWSIGDDSLVAKLYTLQAAIEIGQDDGAN